MWEFTGSSYNDVGAYWYPLQRCRSLLVPLTKMEIIGTTYKDVGAYWYPLQRCGRLLVPLAMM